MANYKIACLGTFRSGTNQHEIELFSTIDNEIHISIVGDCHEVIYLDKSTAIKFSKLLRTEINKIQD